MKETQSSILVESAINAMSFIVRGGMKWRELERVTVRYFSNNGDIIYPVEHYKSRSVQKNTVTAKRNSRAAKELFQAQKELKKVVEHYINLVTEEAALLTGKDKWNKLREAKKIRSASYDFGRHLKDIKYFLDNRSTKIDIVRNKKA